MSSRATRCLVVAVCLSLGTTLGGCICAIGMAAGTGAGALAYSRGEVESTEAMSLDSAWDATLAAAEGMEFRIQEQEKDEFSARLVAERADGGVVRILLDAKGDELTRIRVRSGTFGKESLSRMVIARIRAHHEELTGESAPTTQPSPDQGRHH